jgi:hypothetical protein
VYERGLQRLQREDGDPAHREAVPPVCILYDCNLYCIVLYCIVLYCIVLYCIVLYFYDMLLCIVCETVIRLVIISYNYIDHLCYMIREHFASAGIEVREKRDIMIMCIITQ